ncbi:MAG: hypothetical protein ACRCX2_10345 [Paraclostridium sp.]
MKKYELLKEDTSKNLSMILQYLGYKFKFKNFTICYKDEENRVALISYEDK